MGYGFATNDSNPEKDETAPSQNRTPSSCGESDRPKPPQNEGVTAATNPFSPTEGTAPKSPLALSANKIDGDGDCSNGKNASDASGSITATKSTFGFSTMSIQGSGDGRGSKNMFGSGSAFGGGTSFGNASALGGATATKDATDASGTAAEDGGKKGGTAGEDAAEEVAGAEGKEDDNAVSIMVAVEAEAATEPAASEKSVSPAEEKSEKIEVVELDDSDDDLDDLPLDALREKMKEKDEAGGDEGPTPGSDARVRR